MRRGIRQSVFGDIDPLLVGQGRRVVSARFNIFHHLLDEGVVLRTLRG